MVLARTPKTLTEHNKHANMPAGLKPNPMYSRLLLGGSVGCWDKSKHNVEPRQCFWNISSYVCWCKDFEGISSLIIQASTRNSS